MKYTYDDLATSYRIEECAGRDRDRFVNNLTYGAAGELKSMSWADTTGWATQNWTYNNRSQLTGYTYAIRNSRHYAASRPMFAGDNRSTVQ